MNANIKLKLKYLSINVFDKDINRKKLNNINYVYSTFRNIVCKFKICTNKSTIKSF